MNRDGPQERQLLLLKLQHAFDHAPYFGKRYNGDASSEAQLWISRIGAMLSRVSIAHMNTFRSQKSISIQFWSLSRDGFRRIISEAIEEIKLELELNGKDDFGQVYMAGKEYDFFTDLKGIVSTARSELFLVDAYFDGIAFEAYLSNVEKSLKIKILCGKHASDIAQYVSKFSSQTGATIEIRKTKAIHDRVIFLDKSDCWIVGASIKDAGKKPTYLIPLAPQLSPQKFDIYQEIWSAATLVTL
jgi:hypothetical protein